MKTVATIEARMTSMRLPGKVLADAEGAPMLSRMIDRLFRVSGLDGVVVATTTNATDDPIAALASEKGVGCWRGSEDDVLSRVLEAATDAGADVIVELTGDCPLIDPAIVSQTIRHYFSTGADYVSNVLTRSYPIGMDTQVFSRRILADVASRTDDAIDHEHVSLYIYRHPEIYSLSGIVAPAGLHRPDVRLTLDTPEDLALIRAVFAALLPRGIDFGLAEILAYLDANPVVAALNRSVVHRHV
ncbi:MAG: glycosyltransferase family protein [Rhodospirillales bacterium]|nr:glycosyltransferase family protein [Rhodospirillales bacterium]